MPTNEPVLKFSIFKIADPTGCKRKLSQKSYQNLILQDIYEDFELWISRPSPKPAKWLEALRALVVNPIDLEGLTNGTASFVLLVSVGSETFAVCGGHGAFVAQEFIVEDFGLDILSHVVDPDRIKYMKSRYLAGRTAQEESVYKEYYNYEFDPANWGKITKEILGEISDVDLSEYFDLSFERKHRIRLDGKNSLALNRALSIGELRILISKIVEIEATGYKFKIIAGYEEIKSKDLKKTLNGHLIEILNTQYHAFLENQEEFQEDAIGLSYSDLKEFLFCDSFKINLLDRVVSIEGEIDLTDIFGFLRSLEKGKFASSYLDQITIQGLKDDQFAFENTLRAFLYAELTENQSYYLFVDKKFFSVNDDFRRTVNQKVEDILAKHTLPQNYLLPNWLIQNGKLETEDDYIEHTCQDAQLLKLHRDHVIIHGSDKCEICDIVDIRTFETKFVFVKKGLSSKLRELLSQCRSSGELFRRDPVFRANTQAKIKSKTAALFPCDPEDVSLILAFCDHVSNRSMRPLVDRLTTIVKTDLIHTDETLKGFDYKDYFIYEIKEGF